MDFRIESARLAKELGLYVKVIDRKVTIPVLANLLVRAEADGLKLAGTNLNVTLSGALSASVAKTGVATVPAQKLLEMAKSLPGEIRIWTDDTGALKIAGGTFSSRLQSLPATDFPALPALESDTVLLPRTLLRTMVNQVRTSITDQDQRYLLDGALFSMDGAELKLVSTDSYRLTVTSATLPSPLATKEEHLVPSEALDELAALLGEDAPEDAPAIGFAHSENHLFFTVDGRLLSSRKVDGKFPAWQRILPKEPGRTARMDRAALAQAIDRVLLVASQTSRTISLNFSNRQATVTAVSAEIGDAQETVKADYTGADTSMNVKAASLQDCLRVATVDAVDLQFKDALQPLVFLGGERHMVVIMPIRPVTEAVAPPAPPDPTSKRKTKAKAEATA